jgi:hypothetical protein
MPQYLLLIYVPTGDERPAPDQLAAEHPKWMTYTEQLRDAGVLVGGDALEEIDTATTVRVRGGETVMTDGPFAETKEALAGYYVVEVPDLDEALRWAARMPNIAYGSVEVRPVRVFADMPSGSAA